MIARILIPIVLFSVLPYLWIDRQYLHVRKGWRKILYWLPVAIVIGYSSYLALGADFMPDDPMLIDIMVVLCAMPVATNGTMLCYQYGGDSRTMAQGTFVTTVLSIITIPILVMVIG